MKKLGLEYLDLYLIHQPMGDYMGAWRAMEELYKEGVIRAIGICNFYPHVLANLCETAEIIPAVNQVELHPFFQQADALAVMKEYDIVPEAWGPFAEGNHGIFTHFTMLGSMVSGVILSRHALSFLPISGGRAFARSLHMISAYWGFVFMSLHLGFHWSMMMGMAGRLTGKPSEIRKWILRLIAILISGYGIYAFIKRDIGSYMLLKNQFVFFDFEEPLILFLLDYIASMGLFVAIGHYLSESLKRLRKRKITA